MDKFVNSSKVALLSIVAIVFALFANIFPAVAANTQSIFDNITASSSSTKVGSSETITVHFSEKYNGQIQPGSTYTLNIPQATASEAGLEGPASPTTIPLIDSNNNEQIRTVTIDGTKAVLKFNDNVANLQNIKGEFGFKVVVKAATGANKDQTTKVNTDWGVPVPNVPNITVQPNTSTPSAGLPPIQTAPTPVVPNIGVTKEGTEGQRGNINWQIHGSLSSGANPKDVTITDTLPGTPEQSIQYQNWWLSFTCNTGVGTGVTVTQIPLSKVLSEGWGTITKETNGFVFHLNVDAIANSYGFTTALPMKFTINYQTKPTNPVAGQVYSNTANLNPNNGSSAQSQKATIKISNVWGTANGYNNGTLTISKVDANSATTYLSGAKFTLTGPKDEVVTSDSDDFVKFTGLTAGSYTLKETTAPSGYELNPTTYHFTITDQGTVTDSNLPTSYDIPDTKIASSSSVESSSSSIESSSSSKKESSSSSVVASSSSEKKSSSSSVVPSSSSKKSSSSSITPSSSSKNSSSEKSSSSIIVPGATNHNNNNGGKNSSSIKNESSNAVTSSNHNNGVGIVGKQSSSNNGQGNGKKNGKLPQTGDANNNVIALLGLLVVTIPVVAFAIVERRKNN